MIDGMRISIIAAIGAHDRSLGKSGDLVWRIPDDLKRFKELTMGHSVLMGRKTWESIPEKFRPLPGRTNIIITRQSGYETPGAEIANSLEAAFEIAQKASGAEEVFVIGGGEIYHESLPYTDCLYLTLIDGIREADTFFPEYEKEFTNIISEEKREYDGLPYVWTTVER